MNAIPYLANSRNIVRDLFNYKASYCRRQLQQDIYKIFENTR
jgi:hypothetical protein